MQVSVVTPNYNGEKFLKAFFDSLNQDCEFIG
jgi:glycosyltransferase involved in cell wall biosynthesis